MGGMAIRFSVRPLLICLAAAFVAACTMPAPNLPPTVSLIVLTEPPTATAGPTLLPAIVQTATALALGTVNPPPESATPGGAKGPQPRLRSVRRRPT